MPRIFPIYLFTGDDDYLKKEGVQKLKMALLEKNGSKAFNFDEYEVDKCDIKDVMTTLRSAPFISEKRLVLFKNIDAAGKDAQDAIIRYAQNPSKGTCLVLESSKKELPGEFHRNISEYVREISFAVPKIAQMTEWIRKEVKRRGKIIHHDAASLLKEIKKDDTDGLRSDIEKLITYVGKRPTITREDVEELVGRSPSKSVFDFINALGRKDAKEAIAIAKELSKTRMAIPEILGMIGWQFRKIKSGQRLIKRGFAGGHASGRIKSTPFYVQRFMEEIKSFSGEELDKNIDYLLDADYSIKKGYLKPQDALELLIVKICSWRE